MFKLKSSYKPTGDQPQAIDLLTNGVLAGIRHQVLLGVTGSGKTFTIANVIKNINKPTLIISHNKTLAAQLYQEFREFFPSNAVEFFISYYDYYQPEAYIPQRDLYIEKDVSINEEIDKLRLSATASLLTRKDVIVVASVSCIYNIGSPMAYEASGITVKVGDKVSRTQLEAKLVELLYERTEMDFKYSTFRVRDNRLDIYLPYFDNALSIVIENDIVTKLYLFDPVSGQPTNIKYVNVSFLQVNNGQMSRVTIFPAKHYVISNYNDPIEQIKKDMQERVMYFEGQGKKLEAHRIKQKVLYDIEMIQEIGYCKGIENYSIYFDGRKPGDPPYSLLDYFGDDYLLIIDESHITIPQIRGMYNGDYARKRTLVNYGFRLPTAFDNRPLKFNEFYSKMGYTIYMSATPNDWEIQEAHNAVQLIKKSKPRLWDGT